MSLYRITIDVKEQNIDEFVRNIRLLWFEFLKEEGCVSYHVYRQFENENTFCTIGEYDTDAAMENHFRTQNFELFLGAAAVLGNSFNMIVADVLEKGDLGLARSKRK